MGIIADPFFRRGYADEFQHLNGFVPGFFAGKVLMERDRFANLVSYREYWVQRGHGFLKDHRDLIASDGSHLAWAKLKKVFSLIEDLSAYDTTGRVWDQAH